VEKVILLQQALNPGKLRFARPHDSTVGAGEGFYWVAGFFLLFIVIGTMKAYWDDKDWKGSAYRFQGKKNLSRKK